jgi:acyl-CoA thioester hydrolase
MAFQIMTSIEVRFSDVDSQGHVNHCSMVSWMAHGRVKLLDGLMLQSGESDLDHVLVGLTCNFHKEVFYPGRVEVDARVLKVGDKSVTTEIGITKGNDLVAAATCVNVFFRPSTKESVRIPLSLRGLLEV